jgi:hypothetical protein
MTAMDGDGDGDADEARAEMRDAPPFWSWRAIYLVVVGALAIEAALFAALTKIYSP